jgi:hypothetical protein
LAGGSLAGNDSSIASSSFASALACDSRGGDFRGSFIPAAPWRDFGEECPTCTSFTPWRGPPTLIGQRDQGGEDSTVRHPNARQIYGVMKCTILPRLKPFNSLASFFCNSKRLAGRQHMGSDARGLEVQRPASHEVADRRFARVIDAELGWFRSSPLSTHKGSIRMVDPPSRGRAVWTVKVAPFTLTPKFERHFRRAQAARSAAPDQLRRGDLSDLGGFVCDLSGPPAAVGVLDGGSLAGNDSSSSSSSLSSGFDCGLVRGDFRGSFIPASPWGSPCFHQFKL